MTDSLCSGADFGAITKEYFWGGLQALKHERIDGRHLFEGEDNHMIPSADSKLLRSGIFLCVGKFIAHAIIHCGIGFIGISEAIS